LPLGSPPLLAFSRPDLGAQPPANDWAPPATWETYREWIGAGTADAKPTASPQADRSAAFSLIARALAYTEPSQRAEALFSAEDMTPGVAAAPFVRALGEIKEEAKTASDADALTFAKAVSAVRDGKAVATLGWPSLLQYENSAGAESQELAVFSPLPMAEQVYSQSQADWENQNFPRPMTLLGVEGRLVAVCHSSRNAVTAFKLCQWLTTGDIAVQLSSRSSGTLWYRASQSGKYARWTGGEETNDAAEPVTKVVAEALAVETPVMVPRIPAIDQYMAVLAAAVRDAAPGEEGSKTALAEVVAKWEAITNRLERERQLRSYRRHLGIDSIE
jgi:multiple sugar transport system substrate-binding protein